MLAGVAQALRLESKTSSLLEHFALYLREARRIYVDLRGAVDAEDPCRGSVARGAPIWHSQANDSVPEPFGRHGQAHNFGAWTSEGIGGKILAG